MPSPAEETAAFLIERVRAARGRLWDEGAVTSSIMGIPSGPALRVLATRRVRGVPPVVARGLLAWDRGERDVELLRRIPAAREVLGRQARGRRCVSLVEDAAAAAHGDPRHPDGLSFVLHDLCHLEKFADPAHHRGQVGFFRAVEAAFDDAAFGALERELDGEWRADRDYVISDMNGSAVFLFAVLKMKVNMAVRRRLARERGGLPPTSGPLDEHERAALGPVLAVLFAAMALPEELHASAFAVSARRSQPEDARRLLRHFELRGSPDAGQ
jgi:hypothetical protein